MKIDIDGYIDIEGYITETDKINRFTIKITSDQVPSLFFNDIQVSKEAKVFVSYHHYPSDDNKLEMAAEEDNDLRDRINKCLSLFKELRKGDQIECTVFIVEGKFKRIISKSRKKIEKYANYELWLYSDDQFFKRMEADSQGSLKFRKQWRYTCINREKCKRITGESYRNSRKWWINKNPKIIFPILWGIRLGTAASNLWGRLTRQENLPNDSITHKFTIIGIIVTIIGIIVGIISIAVAIWF